MTKNVRTALAARLAATRKREALEEELAAAEAAELAAEERLSNALVDEPMEDRIHVVSYQEDGILKWFVVEPVEESRRPQIRIIDSHPAIVRLDL